MSLASPRAPRVCPHRRHAQHLEVSMASTPSPSAPPSVSPSAFALVHLSSPRRRRVQASWFVPLLPLLLVGPACQRDPLVGESPDELQALLDDGELDLPERTTGALLTTDAGTTPPPATPPGEPPPPPPPHHPERAASAGAAAMPDRPPTAEARAGGVAPMVMAARPPTRPSIARVPMSAATAGATPCSAREIRSRRRCGPRARPAPCNPPACGISISATPPGPT